MDYTTLVMPTLYLDGPLDYGPSDFFSDPFESEDESAKLAPSLPHQQSTIESTLFEQVQAEQAERHSFDMDDTKDERMFPVQEEEAAPQTTAPPQHVLMLPKSASPTQTDDSETSEGIRYLPPGNRYDECVVVAVIAAPRQKAPTNVKPIVHQEERYGTPPCDSHEDRRCQASRERNKARKIKLATILKKPKEKRTEEEEELLVADRERRARQSQQSRERAREKAAKIARIQAKPVSKRDKREKEWLRRQLETKRKKNLGDRARRLRKKLEKQRQSQSY